MENENIDAKSDDNVNISYDRQRRLSFGRTRNALTQILHKCRRCLSTNQDAPLGFTLNYPNKEIFTIYGTLQDPESVLSKS